MKLFGIIADKSPDETSIGSVTLLAEDGKVLKKQTAARKVKAASPKQGRP